MNLIYISIDLKESDEVMKVPVSREEIINEIDPYSMPSIIMYKPTSSGIVPKIEFYRTPIWVNNLELDGFVFYKAYRDEYSFRENLEYESGNSGHVDHLIPVYVDQSFSFSKKNDF